MEEPLTSLTKTYNEVVKLFGFDLEISDPSIHLTTLHAHLTNIISDSDTAELPKSLASVVRSLHPRLSCVIRTAESLATLVTRSGKVSHLGTAPTACAIFLLAMEGEIRSPLPNCGSLARVLGARLGAKQGVVMDRYRILYGIVEDWIKQVPWLQPSIQSRSRATSSRSKVTTRGAVAKGLNDVVQFQEEIWKKSLCDMEKFSFDLGLIDECDGAKEDRVSSGASHGDGDDDNDFGSVTSASVSELTIPGLMTKRKSVVSSREATMEPISRSVKKRKTRHSSSVESATQFLLDPVNPSKYTDNQLSSHLLSSDSSSLSHTFVHPPTRLQILHVARPGGSDAIADEELFEEGELEDVFRTEEEVRVLAQLVDWDEVEEEKRLNKALREPRSQSIMPNRDPSQFGSTYPRGTRRIDMNAFKKLMDPASDFDGFAIGYETVDGGGAPCDTDDEGAEGDHYRWLLELPVATSETDHGSSVTVSPKGPPSSWGYDIQSGEIVEENWRPMSPGYNGHDTMDYYDL